MSCDITKLDYLNETKQMIREKIDPNGNKITDETPFRNYMKFISGNSFGNAVLITNAIPPSLSVIGTATEEE